MKTLASQFFLSQNHPIWGPAKGIACAPSSIFAVLKIFKMNVTPKNILNSFIAYSDLYQSLDGTSIDEIMSVFSQYGVTAKLSTFCCFGCFWNYLKKTPTPSLIVLKDHVVAVCSKSRARIVLWDPDEVTMRPKNFSKKQLKRKLLYSHDNLSIISLFRPLRRS